MYKIIIADDEIIECRALEKMIQEGTEHCTVIESVYNGLELIKAVEEKKPDIIIVDLNMPGLTGLEAIEILRKKKQSLKIIINTAYSDFEYVKKAMKYQVVDYLLKPVKGEELYTTLRNICTQLDEEKKITEQKFLFGRMEEQIEEITKNHFMEALLLGEMDRESFEVLQKGRGITDTASVLLFFSAFDRNDVEKNKMLMKQLPGFLRRRLSETGLFMWKQYQKGIYCLIIGHMFSDEIETGFLQKVREVRMEAEDVWRIPLVVGISEWKKIPEELVQAPKECQAALQGRTKAGIYLFSRKNKLGASMIAPVFDRSMRIYADRGFYCVLDSMMESLREEERKGTFFQAFKMGEILCLMRILSQENRKSGRWIGHTVMKWEEWMMAENYADLAKNLDKLKEVQGTSQSFKEKKDADANTYVLLALDYMENQYSSDLSLDAVAEQVGITPFYLSRLFRKELEVNFTDILTDLRMGKALELLCEDDCSIKEVCERTGYISLSYFYKVFKKYFGVTAGDILVSIAQITQYTCT